MYDHDDDRFTDLHESVHVGCPYCGEEVELLLDAGGGGAQSYVEDCEVCCQPWQISLTILADGTPDVMVSTLD